MEKVPMASFETLSTILDMAIDMRQALTDLPVGNPMYDVLTGRIDALAVAGDALLDGFGDLIRRQKEGI